MRPKKVQSREGKARRYNKKSFRAAVQQQSQHVDASDLPPRHQQRMSFEHHEMNNNIHSGSSLPHHTSSIVQSIHSQIERITTHLYKLDTTKLILGLLLFTALLLLQYGTRQQTQESMMVRHHSSLESTIVKQSNLRSSKSDGGHQAQSQLPIPMEYINFVELSEFEDAVEAWRVHRDNNIFAKEKLPRRYFRKLQTDNHGPFEINRNEDTDEEAQLQNAIDIAWDQTFQQTDTHIPHIMQASLSSIQHIPFFWHIPRSGGTTLSTLFGSCLGLVQATSSYSSPAIYKRWEDPELANRFKDPKLYVVHLKKQQFVNVDLNDFEGVMRAVKGKLVSSMLADLIVVQDVSLGSFLLEDGPNVNDRVTTSAEGNNKPEFKGVMFAMFRHPMDRAISSFYSQQEVHDVHFDPSMQIYSLTDWANSPQYINDYMVRSLVGKLNERSPQNQPPLHREDLDIAKEILRRKCVIGLMEEKTESLKRFEKFFGWSPEARRNSLSMLDEEEVERAQAEKWRKEIVKDEECKDRLLHYHWEKKHKHPLPEENDASYKLLESKNRYDMELYIYARQLFEEQYLQLGFDDDTLINR